MLKHFHPFGRPKDDRRLRDLSQPPELETFESCLGVSLVNIPAGTASIQCGFEGDTFWNKENLPEEPPQDPPPARDPSPDVERGFAALKSLWKRGLAALRLLWQKKEPPRDTQEGLAAQKGVAAQKGFAAQKGLAALKLRIHTTDFGPEPLRRIGYVFTFSQTTDDRFHSIHRCWPSTLRGTPSFKEVEKEAGVDPSVPTPLGDVHLFHTRRRTQKSEQSNWTVVSQQRPSKRTAGGRCDELAVYWEALQANDLRTWANRPLYSSAVLRCEMDPLTITATVYGYKNAFPFGGRRLCKEILGCSSVRFNMNSGSETDVDTLCAEVESWTNDKNKSSVTDAS